MIGNKDKQDSINLGIVLFVFVAFAYICICTPSCKSTGVSTGDDISPVTKLETELKLVKEDIDKSKKEYGDINGQLTAIENKISFIQSEVNNISNNINNKTINGIQPWVLFVFLGVVLFVNRVMDARASDKPFLKHLCGLKHTEPK